MRSLPPPFRFLLLVVGGWVCVRAANITLPWAAAPEPRPNPSLYVEAVAPSPIVSALPPNPSIPVRSPHPSVSFGVWRSASVLGSPIPLPLPEASLEAGRFASRPATPPDRSLAGLAAWRPTEGKAGRWSASAWLFVRDTEAVALAPGGTLGGSQAGGRLLYRLGEARTGNVALSLRAYAPLSDADAAEVAAGLDWQPSPIVPVHLLLERRQALGSSGRSAFSLTAYGGVSDVEVGPARLDAYAQAGVAGIRSRDLFADGSARLGLPVGGAKIGGGVWGAAQPGAARVDVGPQAMLAFPVGEARITVAADWRFRVAGDAAPGSGPTLTIATDF